MRPDCLFTLDGKELSYDQFVDAMVAKGGIPNAPFKNNAWAELAIKRILRMAAEGGYDSVAWTTGEMQADRYDLSNQVDSVSWEPMFYSNGGRLTATRNGKTVIDEGTTEDKIEDYVGKEISKKLTESGEDTQLSGIDLKVGGTGMKGFYDKILPNLFKKVAGKLDKSAIVGESTIIAGREDDDSAYNDVHSIQITDKMRESAMAGQPLFHTTRASLLNNRAIGMPVKTVQTIVDEFVAGLKVNIDYVVNKSHKEVFGSDATEGDRVKGFYYPKSNNIILIAENLNSRSDVISTLRHETLGHFGLNIFDKKTKKQILDRIIEAKNEKDIKPIWEKVAYDYAGESESVMAEEVFAKVAENKQTRLSKLWNDILTIIQKAFKALGLIDDKVTITELNKLVESIAEGIRRGNKAKTKPASDVAQFNKESDTIEIDGVQRHTKNSEGKPIYPTEEGIRNFWKWFGDSKVVDEQGRPLVVYHGTNQDINEFDKGSVGKNTASASSTEFFFTEHRSEAEEYAKMSARHQPTNAKEIEKKTNALQKRIDKAENSGNWDLAEKLYLELEENELGAINEEDSGQNIMPAYLSIKNPLVVDMKDSFDGYAVADEIKTAKKQRNDGLKLTNVYDPVGERPGAYSTTQWVAFKESQIKSAIGNRGTFSSDEPSILFSKERAGSGFDNWQMPDTMSGRYSTLLTKKEKLAVRARNARRTFQDKHIVWQDVQEQIQNMGGKISDFSDAYNKFTLIEGKIGDQFKKLFDNHIKSLIDDITLSNTSFEQLDKYLYAKFAPQRNKRIAEINPDFPDSGSGMSNEEAQEILDSFSESETKVLERQAQKIYAIQKVKLDALADSGRISSEYRDELLKEDRYVPLKGFADASDLIIDTHATGKGFDQAQDVSKRALGRKSLAADMVLNSIKDTEDGIINAEKNRVGNAVLKLVLDNPNKNLWEVNKIKVEKFFNKRTGQVEQRIVKDYKALARDPNVFITWVKGIPYAILFKDNLHGESSLARALKNMGVDQIPWYISHLAKLNRWLSMVNTALSPEFLFTNPIRDIQTALAKAYGDFDAGIMARVIKNLPRAIRAATHSMGDSKLAHKASKIFGLTEQELEYTKEYLAEGGKTDYYRSKSIEEMRDALNSELKLAGRGVKGSARRVLSKAIKTIEHGNAIFENMTRLSMFITLREAGYSKHQAATASKGLTVNFNRKGEMGVLMNSLYLFYNASMQGTHLTIKLLRKPKIQKVLAVAGSAMIGLTIYNILMGGDDEDGEPFYFKNVSDYEKERNLIIMWPDGSGRYSKIPLSYGLNVPLNAAAALVHIAYGRDIIEQASWVASSAWNSYSPIGENGWNIIAPTVADPFVDIEMNRNYADAPIMPSENPFEDVPTPDSERYFDSTNPYWIGLSKTLNELTGGDEQKAGYVDVSPESVQHLVETYTGAAGGFINRFLSINSETPMSKMPLIRKFYGEENQYTEKQSFLDKKAHILYLKKRYEFLRTEARKNNLDKEAMIDFEFSNKEGLGLISRLEATEKAINKANERRKQLKIDPEENKESILIIEDRIKMLQAEFNKRYNDIYLP